MSSLRTLCHFKNCNCKDYFAILSLQTDFIDVAHIVVPEIVGLLMTPFLSQRCMRSLMTHHYLKDVWRSLMLFLKCAITMAYTSKMVAVPDDIFTFKKKMVVPPGDNCNFEDHSCPLIHQYCNLYNAILLFNLNNVKCNIVINVFITPQ